MSPYQDLVQNVTLRLNDKISKTYSRLFEYYNFNHAWYYKITNEGHFSLMDSNPEWLQYCISNDSFSHYDYYRHPKYFSEGIIWQNNPSNENFSKHISVGKERYNYQLYLRFLNKTTDGVECYGFTSDSCSEIQMSILLNGLPYLRRFIHKVKDNNSYLFAKLKENQIDLAKHIGSSFYEKPNLPLSHLSKSHLLQGFNTNIPALSEVELNMIKLLIEGHSASQIGKELFRSKRTIEHRIEKIKEKFNCYSKVELIQKARELELIGYL